LSRVREWTAFGSNVVTIAVAAVAVWNRASPLWRDVLVVVALIGLWRVGVAGWRKASVVFERKRGGVPTVTLRAFTLPGANRWQLGTLPSGRNEMLLHGHWRVTNVSDQPVYVPGAYVERPRALGLVSVRVPGDNTYRMGSPIPPGGEPSDVMGVFFIRQALRKRGEAFKVDVVLLDHFGNPLRIPGVEFRPLQGQGPDDAPSQS